MTYEEFWNYCSENRVMIDCSTLAERQEFREFVLSLNPDAKTDYISDGHDPQTFPYAGTSRFGNHFCLYTRSGAREGRVL